MERIEQFEGRMDPRQGGKSFQSKDIVARLVDWVRNGTIINDHNKKKESIANQIECKKISDEKKELINN